MSGLTNPAHREYLAARAVTPEAVEARSYFTAPTKAAVERLGFGRAQARPGLVLPLWSPVGEPAGYQLRPDQPRQRDGRVLKFEYPTGAPLRLDVPPLARELVADPTAALWVTEGLAKADALAGVGLAVVGLLGVDCWQSKGVALGDWRDVPLRGREVVLGFDSDAMTKRSVAGALRRLADWLASRGATVRYCYLPPGPAGSKLGVDDWLAARLATGVDRPRALADLLALVEDERRPAPDDEADDERPEHPYLSTPAGLVWHRTRTGRGGELVVDRLPLCNFHARIVADVRRDDGAEVVRRLTVEVAQHDRTGTVEVPAHRLGDPAGWAVEALGPRAVVYAGQGTRDHVRAAVQLLSGEVPTRTVYEHTGWRELAEGWAFLHAGGAVGAAGPVEGVEVHLSGPLAGFELTQVLDGLELAAAVRASLAVLDVAPDTVSVPLLGAVYRAPLPPPPDLVLHLAGRTGAGKSELGALAAQHFGPSMDARHLPGSWSSTPNALEALAHGAAHVVLVVDDFAPAGTAYDVARLHATAERLVRAAGNRSARGRLQADLTLRVERPPRALVLSTGEDVPRGQSVRARLLVVEVGPEVVDFTRLGAHQAAARDGRLAAAVTGYVAWLAEQYDRGDLPARVRADLDELRDRVTRAGQHRRTPAVVASLATGWRWWLDYAEAVGAVTAAEAEALWRRVGEALDHAADAQAEHQAVADPCGLYFRLLGAAVASGRAHLANAHGGAPEPPAAWGWRPSGEDWRPLGLRVGWVDAERVYLEPSAAYAAAADLGRSTGDALAVTEATLRKRLHQGGWLAATSTGPRARLTVRHTLDGARRVALVVHRDALHPRDEPARPAHDGPDDPDEATSRDESGPRCGPRGPGGPGDNPDWPADSTATSRGNGARGPVGPVTEGEGEAARADVRDAPSPWATRPTRPAHEPAHDPSRPAHEPAHVAWEPL